MCTFKMFRVKNVSMQMLRVKKCYTVSRQNSGITNQDNTKSPSKECNFIK